MSLLNGTTVVCPGSFDPVTKGHLDIIKRAAQMFDRVIVVVMHNAGKSPSFTADERVDMLRRTAGKIENVEVDCYDGLLADYVREKKAKAIVKGLRAVSDFEYEFQMARTNKKQCPQADTVFLTAQSENMYLSSSIVKLVGSMDGDISDFVPEEIYEDIKKRLSGKDS